MRRFKSGQRAKEYKIVRVKSNLSSQVSLLLKNKEMYRLCVFTI